MLGICIKRPIGTFVVAISIVILGLATMDRIPVSLLPSIPVPEIIIQANYNGNDAQQIQQLIGVPLRNQLVQIHHLTDVEVTSRDGQASLRMRFDYGTDMDLAYLQVNEKVDMLLESLPKDMPRPRVIKVSADDLPSFQINVSNKNDNSNFSSLSSFCENILKRRLEQMPDIALVDVTGLIAETVEITINKETLQSSALSYDDLVAAITQATQTPENLILKDGHYQYSIGIETGVQSIRSLEGIRLEVKSQNPRIIRLGDIAKIQRKEAKDDGFYKFNGRRAVALAIIKRDDAQLLKLRSDMNDLVRQLQLDYPNQNFEISQDQTELLSLSIKNLISSLLTAVALSLLMTFLFIGERRVFLLVALVIPISLSGTFFALYILGISINIISLAGLALGIGEIIDSAIIIVENIQQHIDDNRNNELDLSNICVSAANEVIIPLTTSVLTNSLVFIPLLFLSGIAGSLFFDQAAAVTLVLCISLFTSYILVPILYYILHKHKPIAQPDKTPLSKTLNKIYLKVFNLAFNRRQVMQAIWFTLVILLAFTIIKLDKTAMPTISRSELQAKIDWNEPIGVQESDKRLDQLVSEITIISKEVGLYVGSQQFILADGMQQSSNQAVLIAKVADPAYFGTLTAQIKEFMSTNYPAAIVKLSPAQNVFEQLFQTSEPGFQIFLTNNERTSIPSVEIVDSVCHLLAQKGVPVTLPSLHERINITILPEKLILYDIDFNNLIQHLKLCVDGSTVSMLTTDNEKLAITMRTDTDLNELGQRLRQNTINNDHQEPVSLGELVSIHKEIDYTTLYTGKTGPYIPLESAKSNSVKEQETIAKKIMSSFQNIDATFSGSYYRHRTYLNELVIAILLVIALIFFILAAQFESLIQPLIVLATIIFGVSGALAFLFFSGYSLNLMSATGIVVLVGLLDNDSILKIDLMNKIRNEMSLVDVIKAGGMRRLQSQVITFLTTVLSLVPILWSAGLGAELQKPLAVTIIGGMITGLLLSWTFIPLVYFWLYTKKSIRNNTNDSGV